MKEREKFWSNYNFLVKAMKHITNTNIIYTVFIDLFTIDVWKGKEQNKNLEFQSLLEPVWDCKRNTLQKNILCQ